MARFARRDGGYFLRALLGIPLGALFAVFATGGNTLEEMLMYLLGGLMARQMPGAFGFALNLLPVLTALYITSGAVTDELSRFAVYMLPRQRGRASWLLGRFALAFFGSLLFYALLLITLALGGVLLGADHAGASGVAQISLALLLTAGLNIALFAVLLNFLKLYLGGALAFFLTWLAVTPGQIAAGLLLGVAGGWPVKLFPSAQGILALHELPALARALPEAAAFALPGFTVAFSACYSLFAAVLLAALGARAIRKYDFTL